MLIDLRDWLGRGKRLWVNGLEGGSFELCMMTDGCYMSLYLVVVKWKI